MGFDPMSIEYIRVAHEDGLGVGDRARSKIVGDVEAANDRGVSRSATTAHRWWATCLVLPLKRFQKLFFQPRS
jgi:hypothetical protein